MPLRTDTHSAIFLGIASLSLVLFLVSIQFRPPPNSQERKLPGGKVVIAAPIQILMYAGDRFLAANLEEMRVAAIGPEDDESLATYRVRAHELVSLLNACQEDNYYLANAMLTWGGSVSAGNKILKQASDCRYWDEFPAFFLGFNRYFFNHDLTGAKEAVDIAAARSTKNRTSLQAISIAIAARKLNDEKMAVAYLRNQRDQATDKILIASLDRRLKRLEGLLTLRDAQDRYEKRYKRQLVNPNELIASGILKAFPQDPMRIGYEYANGRFRMRALNIGGVEIR